MWQLNLDKRSKVIENEGTLIKIVKEACCCPLQKAITVYWPGNDQCRTINVFAEFGVVKHIFYSRLPKPTRLWILIFEHFKIIWWFTLVCIKLCNCLRQSRLKLHAWIKPHAPFSLRKVIVSHHLLADFTWRRYSIDSGGTFNLFGGYVGSDCTYAWSKSWR